MIALFRGCWLARGSQAPHGERHRGGARGRAPAIEKANAILAEAGGDPIEGATLQSLRRTFISLLLAAGADVPYVMHQAGHNDPKTTLGIYAQVIASKTDHGAAFDGLVGHGEASEAVPEEGLLAGYGFGKRRKRLCRLR